MALTIIPSKKQVAGSFDSGRILERKPIGFPHEGGIIKPYSTLFYWAHAWSEKGGLIDIHPHKGFEIMSYVLKGDIEHYDTKLNGWKKLKAGDVQIIRAGSGISHAEKLLPGSFIFQIWFDPDLSKTLSKPATYNDYPAGTFPVFKDEASETKIIFGGTPFTMDSEVGYIQEISFSVPGKSYPLDADSVYSLFLMEGTLLLNEQPMQKGDFAIVKAESVLQLSEIKQFSKIFIIKTPLEPGYPLYGTII